MKRLIGILLAIAMLVTIMPVAAFAQEAEEKLVYQSSTNFSTTAANGIWDEVWSATLIDLSATNPYSTVTTPNAEGTNYRSAHGTYVDADEIAPVTGNDNKNDYATYGGAKTFTAPKDGNIVISFADITHPTADPTCTAGVVKYAWNQGMKFRVTKQAAGNDTATKIYPADAEYVEAATKKSDFDMVASGTTTEVTVKTGDKIHFEVMRMDAEQPWQGVYCDPIITYADEEAIPAPAERDKFVSSEYYDTTGETAKWDSGVWQAWFYDWDDESATTERAKYKLMLGTRTDGDVVKWANNAKSEAGAYNWNGNAAQVGAEFMRVEFIPNDRATTYEKTYSEAVFGYPIGRDYPVKVFAAPKAGYVLIGAETMSLPYESHGSRVRISKLGSSGEPVQVWPASGFNTYDAGTTISFEPVGTTVEAGDMLLFECAFIFGEGFASPYGGAINWDPTVEYTETPAVDPDKPDTPDIPTDKTKYVSSENFSTESGNGTWDDVWSANIVNFTTNTYTTVKNTGTRADASCWQQNAVTVSASEIVPYAGGKENAIANNHIGAAKTFTAPKNGFVQISYAPVIHQSDKKEYGISVFQANKQMSFRVRHDSEGKLTTIYPTVGEYLESRLNDYTSALMLEANKVTNTIEIKKGDKLHFEVKKTLADSDNWNGIYCDPVVEYVDESLLPDTSDPAEKKSYKSSESFNDLENGDYAWKWQYYDINTKEYINLASVSKMAGFGIDPTETATIWYLPQNTQFNKDRGISVGAAGMRVSIDEPDDVATEGEKNGELGRNYPVKSFTAPKSGTVTISAAIFEPGHANGGAAIRLVKHSLDGTQTKLYPEDAEWITILPGDTIPSIKTELEKGEILTFENALWKNNSAWHAIIRWDPVITYTKLVPVLETCNTEAGAKEIPLNKEHILTFSGDVAAPEKSEIKVYEINGSNKTESSAKTKSVVADGRNLKLVFEGLKAYTKYEIEVGGVAFKATPEDTTKVALSFTTGPVVNVLSVEYEEGKVKAVVNNSADTPATATLAVFLCKGTEDSYTVEKTCIATNSSVGANEPIEASLTIPSGDYFVKALVLEDVLAAKAYAPITILKGDK